MFVYFMISQARRLLGKRPMRYRFAPKDVQTNYARVFFISRNKVVKYFKLLKFKRKLEASYLLMKISSNSHLDLRNSSSNIESLLNDICLVHALFGRSGVFILWPYRIAESEEFLFASFFDKYVYNFESKRITYFEFVLHFRFEPFEVTVAASDCKLFRSEDRERCLAIDWFVNFIQKCVALHVSCSRSRSYNYMFLLLFSPDSPCIFSCRRRESQARIFRFWCY